MNALLRRECGWSVIDVSDDLSEDSDLSDLLHIVGSCLVLGERRFALLLSPGSRLDSRSAGVLGRLLDAITSHEGSLAIVDSARQLTNLVAPLAGEHGIELCDSVAELSTSQPS